MKTNINEMVNVIAEQINNDLYAEYENDMHDDVLQIVLKAYNEWQDSEKDGVNHIFNIYEQDDLFTCVKGGMNVKEIVTLYTDATTDYTPYFSFDCNYKKPTPIKWWSDLFKHLEIYMTDVVANVIAYPWCSAYRPIYTKYVTDVIINRSEFEDDMKDKLDALVELKKKLDSDC